MQVDRWVAAASAPYVLTVVSYPLAEGGAGAKETKRLLFPMLDFSMGATLDFYYWAALTWALMGPSLGWALKGPPGLGAYGLLP